MDKLKYNVKKFFSKRNNVIMVASILGVIVLVVIIAIIFGKRKDEKFALNEIYDVYPEEVRELYANMVSVSCYGDLHFDVQLDAGATGVNEMTNNNLIDYMFSYLDKNEKVSDNFEANVIKDATDYLFNGEIDFTSKINSYGYGDYTYTVDGDKVTRKKQECTSDNEYVTHLYGYSWNSQELSMDVNVGYLKDGVLYDLSNNKLGKYSGDVKELSELFVSNSYYRLNYVKDDKVFKLSSVELNSRS